MRLLINNSFGFDHLSLFIFFLFSLLLSSLVLFVSYFFGYKKSYLEKFSVYECGFDPFGDTRLKFDVKFYLVSILFIVFDLEIAFLFPWAICLPLIGLEGYLFMMVFLLILVVGFIYEWTRGALEW